VLSAAGAVTMPLASRALAVGPLAASQPGFTILDPLAASLPGVFQVGEHIRTDAAALVGEALTLAGGSGGPAGTRQLPDQAAEGAQPGRGVRSDRTRPGPAATRTGPPRQARKIKTLIPNRLRPDCHAGGEGIQPGPNRNALAGLPVISVQGNDRYPARPRSAGVAWRHAGHSVGKQCRETTSLLSRALI
jgi:hypothetical protein